MGIEMLGGLEIHTILNKLGPKETIIVGCVSHNFRDWASDDSLWSQFCAKELLLYSPEDPMGSATPSFKVRTFNFPIICIIHLHDLQCMQLFDVEEVSWDKARSSLSIEIYEHENT